MLDAISRCLVIRQWHYTELLSEVCISGERFVDQSDAFFRMVVGDSVNKHVQFTCLLNNETTETYTTDSCDSSSLLNFCFDFVSCLLSVVGALCHGPI